MNAFADIARMNIAYGNPAFDFDGQTLTDEQWAKLESQCKNILDEYNELMDAIAARQLHGKGGVRDGLCDIVVFAGGASHFIGQDIEGDLKEVYSSNMSKFCRTQAEVDATVDKYQALGVQVYVEGEFPTMRVKCAADFVDAAGNAYRKGKMLKGVGFVEPELA